MLFLGGKRLCGLSRVRDNCLSACSVASPDQYSTVFIGSKALSLGKFKLQILQRLIIKLKLPLEGAIGQTSSTLEHLDGLFENFVKRHGMLPAQPCSSFVNFLHQCRLEEG